MDVMTVYLLALWYQKYHYNWCIIQISVTWLCILLCFQNPSLFNVLPVHLFLWSHILCTKNVSNWDKSFQNNYNKLSFHSMLSFVSPHCCLSFSNPAIVYPWLYIFSIYTSCKRWTGLEYRMFAREDSSQSTLPCILKRISKLELGFYYNVHHELSLVQCIKQSGPHFTNRSFFPSYLYFLHILTSFSFLSNG